MPPSTATWLVIEPTITGHHFTYLEHLVAGALRRGLQVVVGVGEDDAGLEIERRLREGGLDGELSFVRAPTPRPATGPARLARDMVGWRRYYAQVWRAAGEQRRVDYVLLPYLDHGLFALALLGSPFGNCRFAGVTMRQRFHFPDVGVRGAVQSGVRWRRRLFGRLLALPTLDRVFVIDESLPEHLSRCAPMLARKLIYVPDPSDPVQPVERSAARSALGLPASGRIVLLYGYIEARKGVAELLDWAAANVSASDLHVVLAGRVDRDSREAVNGAAAARLRSVGRLHQVERYVTAGEEQLLLSAADWVWLGYRNFEFMSGVLVKAAQHGLGVLFRDFGLIGRYVRRHAAPVNPAGLPMLPSGVELRTFGDRAGAVAPLPEHSWDHACRIVFDGATH